MRKETKENIKFWVEIFVALVTLFSFLGTLEIFRVESSVRKEQREARIEALNKEFSTNINIINKEFVPALKSSSIPGTRLKFKILENILYSGEVTNKIKLDSLWAIYHEVEAMNYDFDKMVDMAIQNEGGLTQELRRREKNNLNDLKIIKIAMQLYLGNINGSDEKIKNATKVENGLFIKINKIKLEER